MSTKKILKVGDKVRVRDIEVGTAADGDYFCSGMTVMIGETFEVIDLLKHKGFILYLLDSADSYAFSSDWLELVEEKSDAEQLKEILFLFDLVFANYELWEKAKNHFGEEHQKKVACEEAAEMIVALIHHGKGSATAEEVASEIADSIIMAAQMRLLFGKELVDKQILFKMKRLEQRIDNETN